MSGGLNGVRLSVAALSAAGLVAVGGCDSTQDDAVQDVAARFYAALDAGDGAAACQALAPRARSEAE
jgi:hypothetical protein